VTTSPTFYDNIMNIFFMAAWPPANYKNPPFPPFSKGGWGDLGYFLRKFNFGLQIAEFGPHPVPP
jgi:hypothetical protein